MGAVKVNLQTAQQKMQQQQAQQQQQQQRLASVEGLGVQEGVGEA